MNSRHLNSPANAADVLGLRVTSRLTRSLDDLPHDVTERLRAARVQAVEKRKQVLLVHATTLFAHGHSGSLTAGHADGHSSWWSRLGIVGLLLVLAAGLFLINVVQDDMRASELADIDAAILTDDLPPAAYTDPGFAQFLKISHRQEP
jgi:hypothetical protein